MSAVLLTGSTAVYFSGFSIWDGVSQLMGVKLSFRCSSYNVQFYNKTTNITIFLLFSWVLYCIIVKNFLGSLTTVVRAQNDTSKTVNIT